MFITSLFDLANKQFSFQIAKFEFDFEIFNCCDNFEVWKTKEEQQTPDQIKSNRKWLVEAKGRPIGYVQNDLIC